ncbi:MAG: transaldolase [Deltaproteobacteria bacterium]|nr:transaldolase [Deltaproteobacteria bacterium]
MKKNPLFEIRELGQSIWLDFIRRKMMRSGELDKLISEDGIRGITSNPSIFKKAIADSEDYDDHIGTLAGEGKKAREIYEILTVKDVQDAADHFRPLFDASDGRNGFVSLEVNPHLARDVEGTLVEARRLWSALCRPNVLIKVPATREGLTCVTSLIDEGINVNVTLLFGLLRYREVAGAYIEGLEKRAERGDSLSGIASVASFFLSRIDVLVDPLLEEKMKEGREDAEKAKRIHGEVAVSSAKVAYGIYKEIFKSERFQALAARGARPQRVLWASTSTKNPEYSDTKYVEPLIGPETVNTLPRETLDAYRDHGEPSARLEEGLGEAEEVLQLLSQLDIDLDEVTRQLENEGIEKFNKPYDALLQALVEKANPKSSS